VIAVSRYSLGALERSSYRHCRLAMVHNGIDTAHFAPALATATATAEQRRRWLGDGGTLLLGSTAGTAAYKGWMDLVEAMALLPASLRDQVRVVVAGKPPGAAQQARIAELGLGAHVQFTGLLADVRPVIAAIDVGFVLSFDVETISFACREMMAMGKPVLLTDYAGLPENIEPGREGWLVPVRSPQAIADRLRQMLDERVHLPVMGAAARTRALEEFGFERFVDRTETVYRQLLAAEEAPGPATRAA
jgi:glycosyltransferase involved in cell wall biosynthesis